MRAPTHSVLTIRAGNGSLMRLCPVPLVFYSNPEQAYDFSEKRFEKAQLHTYVSKHAHSDLHTFAQAQAILATLKLLNQFTYNTWGADCDRCLPLFYCFIGLLRIVKDCARMRMI
jgi:ADP-ribosylglycohydrolase